MVAVPLRHVLCQEMDVLWCYHPLLVNCLRLAHVHEEQLWTTAMTTRIMSRALCMQLRPAPRLLQMSKPSCCVCGLKMQNAQRMSQFVQTRKTSTATRRLTGKPHPAHPPRPGQSLPQLIMSAYTTSKWSTPCLANEHILCLLPSPCRRRTLSIRITSTPGCCMRLAFYRPVLKLSFAMFFLVIFSLVIHVVSVTTFIGFLLFMGNSKSVRFFRAFTAGIVNVLLLSHPVFESFSCSHRASHNVSLRIVVNWFVPCVCLHCVTHVHVCFCIVLLHLSSFSCAETITVPVSDSSSLYHVQKVQAPKQIFERTCE